MGCPLPGAFIILVSCCAPSWEERRHSGYAVINPVVHRNFAPEESHNTPAHTQIDSASLFCHFYVSDAVFQRLFDISLTFFLRRIIMMPYTQRHSVRRVFCDYNFIFWDALHSSAVAMDDCDPTVPVCSDQVSCVAHHFVNSVSGVASIDRSLKSQNYSLCYACLFCLM